MDIDHSLETYVRDLEEELRMKNNELDFYKKSVYLLQEQIYKLQLSSAFARPNS